MNLWQACITWFTVAVCFQFQCLGARNEMGRGRQNRYSGLSTTTESPASTLIVNSGVILFPEKVETRTPTAIRGKIDSGVASTETFTNSPTGGTRKRLQNTEKVKSGLLISGVSGNSDSGNALPETTSTKQIPLKLFQHISNIDDPSEFLKMLTGSEKLLQTSELDPNLLLGISQRMGGIGSKSDPQIPKNAKCMPELQPVKVFNESQLSSQDPLVIYFPDCIRIERCGGCCHNSLLQCKPTKTEMVSYKIIKSRYTGSNKVEYVGTEIVEVEQHTHCKCDCKIEAHHCNSRQSYRPLECSCQCKNLDEKANCETVAMSKTRVWNQDVCACKCRYTEDCSTGFYYDQQQCSCIRVPDSRSAISPPDSGSEWPDDDLLNDDDEQQIRRPATLAPPSRVDSGSAVIGLQGFHPESGPAADDSQHRVTYQSSGPIDVRGGSSGIITKTPEEDEDGEKKRLKKFASKPEVERKPAATGIRRLATSGNRVSRVGRVVVDSTPSGNSRQLADNFRIRHGWIAI